MPRGFVIRVDRVNAMRVLAESIRTKTEEFEKAKKSYPKQFAADKAKAEKLLRSKIAKLSKAKTRDAARACTEIEWRERKDLFGTPPMLNLCSEKHALDMLKIDCRKTVSINSNSALWGMIEGKCEVIR